MLPSMRCHSSSFQEKRSNRSCTVEHGRGLRNPAALQFVSQQHQHQSRCAAGTGPTDSEAEHGSKSHTKHSRRHLILRSTALAPAVLGYIASDPATIFNSILGAYGKLASPSCLFSRGSLTKCLASGLSIVCLHPNKMQQ